MIENLFFFIIGFVFLLKGADFLVDGSSSISKKLGIAPLIIGLTVVSFGTSAPELLINIISSPISNDIPIGNIIGSNITNILLILGIAAMLRPLTLHKSTVWREIPFSLVAIILLAVIVNDALIVGGISEIDRIDGVILLIFFGLFLYYVSILIRVGRGTLKDVVLGIIGEGEQMEEVEVKERPYKTSFAFVLLGIAGLVIGGEWVVNNSIIFAKSFGLSEALIGLTILAIGSSLPELITSVVAALKKQSDIAIGNIVGSNIFNVLWILGISSLIRPLTFSTALNIDLFVAIFSTVLLFIFMFVGRKQGLDRKEGLVFVLLYVIYLAFLIMRG